MQIKDNICRVIFAPLATGGESVCRRRSVLAVMVPSSVKWLWQIMSQTLLQTAAFPVCSASLMRMEKKRKKKWNYRSLQRAELQKRKEKKSKRTKEHKTPEVIAVVVPDGYTHANMYQVARGKRLKQQTWLRILRGDENNLPIYIMQLPAE